LQHIYIDLSFLPKYNNNIGFILLVDHFTKRIWCKSIPSKHASHVVSFLEEIFQSIGLEQVENCNSKYEFYLRSDNGGEFISTEVKKTCERYGIIYFVTSLDMES